MPWLTKALYDDKAVEGFVKFCERELTLTDGSDTKRRCRTGTGIFGNCRAHLVQTLARVTTFAHLPFCSRWNTDILA